MKEWIETSKDYWSFGAFMVLFLGICGGLATLVADWESRALITTFEGQVKQVVGNVNHNRKLIEQIDLKLDAIGENIGKRSDRLEERLDKKIDRVDAKLDELLLRMSTQQNTKTSN